MSRTSVKYDSFCIKGHIRGKKRIQYKLMKIRYFIYSLITKQFSCSSRCKYILE